jgi:hypothetical protein
MPSPPTAVAVELMTRFADRTGLTAPARAPVRYLWTDAFAVCNFLALTAATGEGRHAELALGLVDQVHHVLGRHRPDDPRRGWPSGLEPRVAEAHPTRGGLRIGKPRPERDAGKPGISAQRAGSGDFDERLEWERDGQYFHYLTKWMTALDRVARATGQATFNVWARELAETVHRAFTHPLPGGGTRMYWKCKRRSAARSRDSGFAPSTARRGHGASRRRPGRGAGHGAGWGAGERSTHAGSSGGVLRHGELRALGGAAGGAGRAGARDHARPSKNDALEFRGRSD